MALSSRSRALIHRSDQFFVAGHCGMAGSAICRTLQRAGYGDPWQGGCLLTPARDDLDQLDLAAVVSWFKQNLPTVVIVAAAQVGDIPANHSFPADFLLENLKIQTHLIDTVWRCGARRLLFLGSSRIYLKLAPQPLRKQSQLTGSLEPTRPWYAISKITGIKLVEALRLQHGFDGDSLMPTNLYGRGVNCHPLRSHVLPTLIRRFHEALENHYPTATCWGTGTPLREFLHVDDLGKASVFALENGSPDASDASRDVEGQPLTSLNVGKRVDQTIRQLAEAVAEATGFLGAIEWDSGKPDGILRKQLVVSRMRALGWQARIALREGLKHTLSVFCEQLQQQLVRL